MQDESLDLRGLACPEPVVQTRKAIMRGDSHRIAVLVDDRVSAENIERMAGTLAWSVVRDEREGEIQLVLFKSDAPAEAVSNKPEDHNTSPKIAVFVTSNQFGTGDAELGDVLMRAFIKTLKELNPLPDVAIFANSGIRLTTSGSILIDDLKELEAAGVRILSCGTCLDYYHLNDALEVGQVTNMFEIASTLAAADRVLRP